MLGCSTYYLPFPLLKINENKTKQKINVALPGYFCRDLNDVTNESLLFVLLWLGLWTFSGVETREIMRGGSLNIHYNLAK